MSADSVEVEDDSDNEFPNVSLSCEVVTYKPGDLVWLKYGRYCDWPAVIEKFSPVGKSRAKLKVFWLNTLDLMVQRNATMTVTVKNEKIHPHYKGKEQFMMTGCTSENLKYALAIAQLYMSLKEPKHERLNILRAAINEAIASQSLVLQVGRYRIIDGIFFDIPDEVSSQSSSLPNSDDEAARLSSTVPISLSPSSIELSSTPPVMSPSSITLSSTPLVASAVSFNSRFSSSPSNRPDTPVELEETIFDAIIEIVKKKSFKVHMSAILKGKRNSEWMEMLTSKKLKRDRPHIIPFIELQEKVGELVKTLQTMNIVHNGSDSFIQTYDLIWDVWLHEAFIFGTYELTRLSLKKIRDLYNEDVRKIENLLLTLFKNKITNLK